MNTNNSHIVIKSLAVYATAVVAVIGAAVLATSQPRTEIVQLERVVIVGKRSSNVEAPQIAQLPRVVITGRSTRGAAADDVLLAANANAANKTL